MSVLERVRYESLTDSEVNPNVDLSVDLSVYLGIKFDKYSYNFLSQKEPHPKFNKNVLLAMEHVISDKARNKKELINSVLSDDILFSKKLLDINFESIVMLYEGTDNVKSMWFNPHKSYHLIRVNFNLMFNDNTKVNTIYTLKYISESISNYLSTNSDQILSALINDKKARSIIKELNYSIEPESDNFSTNYNEVYLDSYVIIYETISDKMLKYQPLAKITKRTKNKVITFNNRDYTIANKIFPDKVIKIEIGRAHV